MEDVRRMSKNIVLIVVVLYILSRLRHLVLSTYPLGITLSWFVWGVFVLCLSSAVYIVLVILIKIYCAVFAVKYERAAVEEVLLYWGTMVICGLAVYHRWPSAFESILDFMYRFEAAFGYYAGDIAREWLASFGYIRWYMRVFYGAVTVMFTVRLFLVSFHQDATIGKIIKGILWPLLIICIPVVLAYVNHAQLTVYRVWPVLIILAIFGLYKAVLRVTLYITVSEPVYKSGPRVYATFTGITGTTYDSIVDSAALIADLGALLIAQLVAVISLVIYVIMNFRLILSIYGG